jgi:hypothetical protein
MNADERGSVIRRNREKWLIAKRPKMGFGFVWQNGIREFAGQRTSAASYRLSGSFYRQRSFF